MLSPLFNFLWDNEVINEINLGNFTTNSFNMTLFPNTYLFDLNASNPNVRATAACSASTTISWKPEPSRSRVGSPNSQAGSRPASSAVDSRTSPRSRTKPASPVDDPFVDNPTPVWQFPGQPANSTECQGNLEIGDPIEVLPNATQRSR